MKLRFRQNELWNRFDKTRKKKLQIITIISIEFETNKQTKKCINSWEQSSVVERRPLFDPEKKESNEAEQSM